MFNPDSYIPLELGGRTSGWVTKDFPTTATNIERKTLAVTANGKAISIDAGINKNTYRSFFPHKDESFEFWLFNTRGKVVLNLPDSFFSKISSGDMIIDYTERNVRMIYSALHTYYILLKSHLQKTINAQPDEPTVIRKLASFYYYYGSDILTPSMWRGALLDDSLFDTEASLYHSTKNGVHLGGPFYVDYGKLFWWAIEQTRPIGVNLKATPNTLYNNPRAACRALYIAFPNADEFEKENRFRSDHWESMMSDIAKRESLEDRIFVLGSADDPIKPWTLGRHLSSEQFTDLYKKGAPIFR